MTNRLCPTYHSAMHEAWPSRPVRRIDSRLAAFALIALAIYGVWLADHRARNAGGSDSSGYLNAARLLAAGRVVVPIEPLRDLGLPPGDAPLFIPLGFYRGPRPGTMVPYYTIGMPLHIVAAEKVATWRVGPWLVSPLAAVVAVLLTYFIATELGLGFWWAFAAGAILASFATFDFQAVQVMSDVPATAWACATIWCALKSRGRPVWALGAGAALGIAVLVRPTCALFALPVLVVLGFDLRRLALLAAGGAPFAAIDLAYNAIAFGNPLLTGYSRDLASNDLSLAFFPARFRHYVYWMSALLTPLVPIGWLGACASRILPGRVRLLLATWVLPTFLFYCCYRHYDEWWYTRFLLPVTPGIIIGALLCAREVLHLRISSRRPFTRRGTLKTLTTIACIGWIAFASTAAFRRFHPMTFGCWNASYLNSWAVARYRLPDHAYVLSMQTSGTLEFYGDLRPVRWDLLNDGRLTRLEAAHDGGRLLSYALLFPFEVDDFKRRVPGSWRQVDKVGLATLWARQ